ncbi:MAG: DUF421 domain-containing protein [Clostridia bacterium]|nr:DUF421 domain-containing protein [Clostridia bacterium]MDD4798032.1 DUF421 domain-containing protein [Clostridia bacterium]
MLLLIIRTVILYIFIFFALKALGKRQIGELEPIELVVILIISETTAIAIQSNAIPLFYSIVPTAALCILQIFISLINLKSIHLRNFIYGRPAILIKNGLVQQDEMRRLRVNISDLMEQLRCQGVFNVNDVEFALLENNGDLSTYLKRSKQPLTVGDMIPDCRQETPPIGIVFDGVVNIDNLKSCGRDENWLKAQLKKEGINNPSEIFIGGIDEKGEFYFQKREKKCR